MDPYFKFTDEIKEMLGDISKLEKLVAKKEYDRYEVLLQSVSSTLEIEHIHIDVDFLRALLEGACVTAPADELEAAYGTWHVYGKMDSYHPYGCKELLSVHKRLMRELTKEAGSFRKGDVGIRDEKGNILHMGARPELVPELIEDLMHFLRYSDLPMPIKSALFHAEFEMIHPFADGNGRMGRLWHTLLLYNLSPVYSMFSLEKKIYEHLDDYYHTLKVSSLTGDSTLFVTFMLDIIRDALIELNTTESK